MTKSARMRTAVPKMKRSFTSNTGWTRRGPVCFVTPVKEGYLLMFIHSFFVYLFVHLQIFLHWMDNQKQ